MISRDWNNFSPSSLYRAVDYYRKRLYFFVYGVIRPLKPIFECAYQLVSIPKIPKNKLNNNSLSHYRKDLYLNQKINVPNERLCNTTI